MFRDPWWLLGLLAVPALVFRRWRPGRRAAVSTSDAASLASLPRTWRHRARLALPVLQALGLAALAVALARPQRALTGSRVETEGVDMVLVVDTSTSMEDNFSATRRLSRMTAAKEVLERFVGERPDDRIGLVAFAALPYALSPLTTDHGWLRTQIDRLRTGMLADGTAIGDAIASAVNRLRDSQAKSKVVVLLTDGLNNRGELSPLDAAQAAAALGIRIHVVGAAGTPFPAAPSLFGPGIDPAEGERQLEQVAEITGGRYFRAGDARGLQEIYDAIDEMEKTEITQDAYTRHEELFAPFALAALLLLGLEWALGATSLGRVPS